MRRWLPPVKLGVICLLLLSACVGLPGRTGEQDLSALLRSLKEAGQKGEVGSVEGNLYLIMPGPPTPLKDWPVTLIPLPPALEATVAAAHAQFTRSGRMPLSAEALARARDSITTYPNEVAALGYSELIRTVKTAAAEPKFSFQGIPHGRWLLLAELPSKITVLLWAVPVTVTTGEVTWQTLNDGIIWLEGLRPR